MEIMTNKDIEFVERFWRNVAVKESNECWEWKKCTQGKGYGSVGIGKGRTALAHRVAYRLT